LLGLVYNIRKSDNYLVARNGDCYRSKPRPRVSRMNTGPNVELVSVPGANYVHRGFREHHAFAGTVLGDNFLNFGDHLALAGGSAHVWTVIEIGEKLAIELEYGYLESLEGDNPATRICELRRRTDVYLAH
jgi:hypothetical protein